MNLFDIKGKVVLVTGSTHGLGMSMAQGLGLAVDTIVHLKENNQFFYHTKEGNQVLLSHGKQPENKDGLGMAFVTGNSSISNNETPKDVKGITNTHLLNLGATKNQSFYFMSGWAASDSQFNSELWMREAIDAISTIITKPISIK